MPPLLVLLVFALLMLGADRVLPVAELAIPWRGALAVVMLVFGTAVAIAGVFAFRRHATTVDPTQPTNASTLVASGVYRYTRNPMYLGFALALAAWALVLSNLAALALVAVFALYLQRFQILPEERALSERFGEEFARYRARVRRWL